MGNFLVHEWGRAFAPNTPPDQKEALDEKMKQLTTMFSGMCPGLGVTPETIPGIERSYLELLRLMNEHLKHHAYILGGRPCMADFALMGPLYAHLYRDPYPGALMK